MVAWGRLILPATIAEGINTHTQKRKKSWNNNGNDNNDDGSFFFFFDIRS